MALGPQSNGRVAQRTINLAIDLDGVLTEHPRPLATAASAQFGLDLPERAFVDSAGLNVPQAVRDWVYSDDGPAARLDAARGAQDFLRSVIDLLGPNNVRIITARSASSAEMTRAWLLRHGFPAVDITFADDKPTAAFQRGCTVAVEDSLRHARAYAASGILCYLIAPEGAIAEKTTGIIRVDGLAEVIDRLADEIRESSLDGNGDASSPAKPKIVIADVVHPIAREQLALHAEIVDVDGTDRPALFAALPEADALIVRSETQVTADVIAAGPKLRVIARAGVGVDNVELDAATRAGVLVLNAPGANRYSAGEHTIALLLALTREVVPAHESTTTGRWDRKRFKPIDLRGRTVGIVGLGRVGAVVAKRLAAFEMNVLAYDPYIIPDRFRELGVTPVDYETLLQTSDVVTFHVPSTSETRHMLDAERIELLREDAIVINCSRGDVVDENALAEALQTGRIRAAGVDVYPHEPCRESPLFGLPNAVLSPHIGGSSEEALRAVGEMISSSVLAALAGQAVPNAVNLPPASLLAPELQRLTTVASAAGHVLAVLQPSPPAAFRVTVNGCVPGDVAEHVAGASLSSALNQWTHNRVTPVNARLIAGELGMDVRVDAGTNDPGVQPSFSFEASGEPEEIAHQVRIVWDRMQAAIVAVDRFSLDRPLSGEMLITHHRDVPGVIGRVGTVLGRYEVNIAGMEVGRHHRGEEALMVVNVDDTIPEEAIEEIRSIPGMETAYCISLPKDLHRGAFDPVPESPAYSVAFAD
ncbi:MAG: phosphoglycerate dehydrogenase [Thermomicrobiales bacterium]|nr:phosphoglycerate dehydrogenase [Thermomicrobiales bacterium]